MADSKQRQLIHTEEDEERLAKHQAGSEWVKERGGKVEGSDGGSLGRKTLDAYIGLRDRSKQDSHYTSTAKINNMNKD